jgi:hypothetical protein
LIDFDDIFKSNKTLERNSKNPNDIPCVLHSLDVNTTGIKEKKLAIKVTFLQPGKKKKIPLSHTHTQNPSRNFYSTSKRHSKAGVGRL